MTLSMKRFVFDRSNTAASSNVAGYSDIDATSEFASIQGDEDVIVAANAEVIGDKLFVAVGRKVSECKSTLQWALQNSGGNKICLLHVHQPSQTIPILGGKFPVNSVGEQELKAHRMAERQEMNKILDEYLRICSKAGLQAETLNIDKDSIEKGIIELICQNKIGKLVMGGAADGRFSRKMIEPKSKKANYVRAKAPTFCHIWFICKGRLIHTREGTKETIPRDGNMSALSPSPTIVSRASTPESIYSGGGYQSSRKTYSQSSAVSISSEASGDFPHFPFPPISQRGSPADGNQYASVAQAVEGGVNDGLYEQLERAMSEAESSRLQAFQESNRRVKAEKETLEAIRKAKSIENLYVEELRRRKGIEQELASRDEELENVKNQLRMVLEELEIAREEKSLLENRVEKSDLMVNEVEEKLASAGQVLQNYKKQHGHL